VGFGPVILALPTGMSQLSKAIYSYFIFAYTLHEVELFSGKLNTDFSSKSTVIE
jgi:hypothetical protein